MTTKTGHLDINLQVPTNRLREFIILLPEWVTLINVSNRNPDIVPKPPKVPKVLDLPTPNKGTAREDVLKLIREVGPLRVYEITSRLKGDHKGGAVNAAIYHLRDKGLIVQGDNKSYAAKGPALWAGPSSG